ncbi:hypothetical protein B0H16DRAFT_1456884 [Mycena metata]|uniref:Uncharacterized protein n=1 Tax=Mycena metata TaxID=1033252 RepID=A0AAD7J938_9AGAR|nr:hypothetical protein B0H16DRAFT_1456884 [Mycena metata]
MPNLGFQAFFGLASGHLRRGACSEAASHEPFSPLVSVFEELEVQDHLNRTFGPTAYIRPPTTPSFEPQPSRSLTMCVRKSPRTTSNETNHLWLRRDYLVTVLNGSAIKTNYKVPKISANEMRESCSDQIKSNRGKLDSWLDGLIVVGTPLLSGPVACTEAPSGDPFETRVAAPNSFRALSLVKCKSSGIPSAVTREGHQLCRDAWINVNGSQWAAFPPLEAPKFFRTQSETIREDPGSATAP